MLRLEGEAGQEPNKAKGYCNLSNQKENEEDNLKFTLMFLIFQKKKCLQNVWII